MVYNNNKFYAANEECIKIFSVKLTMMENTPTNNAVKRIINKNDVAEIPLYDKTKRNNKGNKIHGLHVTIDGREKSGQTDFV